MNLVIRTPIWSNALHTWHFYIFCKSSSYDLTFSANLEVVAMITISMVMVIADSMTINCQHNHHHQLMTCSTISANVFLSPFPSQSSLSPSQSSSSPGMLDVLRKSSCGCSLKALLTVAPVPFSILAASFTTPARS